MLCQTIFLFSAIQLCYSSCGPYCLECAKSICSACPSDRQLVKNTCECQAGYLETDDGDCLRCNNPYCYRCSKSDLSVCRSCGVKSVTNRKLVGDGCQCIEGYVNVPWSYACQSTTIDIRILRFQHNVNQQQAQAELSGYQPSTTISDQLVLAISQQTNITSYESLQCPMPSSLGTAIISECPDGQLYQQLNKNIFGIAFLQNRNTGTKWINSYNELGLKLTARFVNQRNLTQTYNIIGYQFQYGDQILLECLIVENLNVDFNNAGRLLEDTFTPYMQYLFYIAYQRSDLLSSDELEVILDKLMALINGCMDFCEQCSIFRDTIQCSQCSGYREFMNNQCQCPNMDEMSKSCYELCPKNCQVCLYSCFGCEDVTQTDFSSDCPQESSSTDGDDVETSDESNDYSDENDQFEETSDHIYEDEPAHGEDEDQVAYNDGKTGQKKTIASAIQDTEDPNEALYIVLEVLGAVIFICVSYGIRYRHLKSQLIDEKGYDKDGNLWKSSKYRLSQGLSMPQWESDLSTEFEKNEADLKKQSEVILEF